MSSKGCGTTPSVRNQIRREPLGSGGLDDHERRRRPTRTPLRDDTTRYAVLDKSRRDYNEVVWHLGP